MSYHLNTQWNSLTMQHLITPFLLFVIAVPSPTNTVSSSGSSHYVEAIHVPELTKTGESKSATGSYEFKVEKCEGVKVKLPYLDVTILA